ncbi:hypothetical protein N7478_005609 [Penicillium angulare]|uniref:uncharacterized protein n=1 Tax=Penicillium angulare TaxID=116970 RepID=UPI0025408D96|nr:uncharacterized protein N7478_005609 [Penicillium angulare]KAJ5280237.1 hypothetical protein N7478_005609 [Penicillium angulare]
MPGLPTAQTPDNSSLTFYSRPEGSNQPWFSFTEYMQPDITTLSQGAVPYNRLARSKPWSLPQLVTSSVQLNKI